MKKILFLAFITFILGCETPKKKESKPELVKEEIKAEKKVEKVDLSLISIKKSPCSGDCPVFEVQVTKDSLLTYIGKKYTSILGEKKIKLSRKEFDNLIRVINESNFKGFKSQYSNQDAKDFSETTITYQGKNVSVRLWKDAPEELTNIYVVIEDILYKNKFLE